MSASLGPEQAKFVSTLSRETGLNPRVVGAWALAEQSGSAAHYYEGKNYNNFLNIANTDSGPAKGADSAVWMNPESAAKATAAWLKGGGQIAKEYGAPAPGIRGILSTRGQGPEQQIQAISKSGWASSGYNGGSTLRSLAAEINPAEIPKASMPTGVPGVEKATTSVTAPTTAFDKAAYTEASTGATIGKLYSRAERQENPLFTLGTLSTTEPSKAEFETSVPGKVAATPATASLPGQPGKYVDPLPSGFTQGRTDQGVDFSATPGSSIRAIGSGKVLGVENNWYDGQPFVYYELNSGPQKGKVVYVAEQISPTVKAGDELKAGQQIGTYANSGTGIETGFATKSGQTHAMATTGYTEGEETQSGKEFETFLKGLKGS